MIYFYLSGSHGHQRRCLPLFVRQPLLPLLPRSSWNDHRVMATYCFVSRSFKGTISFFKVDCICEKALVGGLNRRITNITSNELITRAPNKIEIMNDVRFKHTESSIFSIKRSLLGRSLKAALYVVVDASPFKQDF